MNSASNIECEGPVDEHALCNIQACPSWTQWNVIFNIK